MLASECEREKQVLKTTLDASLEAVVAAGETVRLANVRKAKWIKTTLGLGAALIFTAFWVIESRQQEQAAPVAVAAPATLAPEMVRIPADCFQMGSPEGEKNRESDDRQHRVCVEAFDLGKTEVTFAQWDACVADGGCNDYRPPDEGWGRGNRPVIKVSWKDAQAYAQWLSGKTKQTWRLPTEAEWEYAARGKTSTAYWWGDAIGRNNANCEGCGSQWDNMQTAPVSSFAANRFGLYDTSGNVWEWTCSAYDKDYGGGETRCAEASDDSGRAVRGGSWDLSPGSLRAAERGSSTPGDRSYYLGFRVARTVSP